ncbi:MAG: hypothetical protein NT150_04850 [Bacteroidetes bacterium]|nr:hypothetical protein [Bacteroidota bacterium]
MKTEKTDRIIISPLFELIHEKNDLSVRLSLEMRINNESPFAYGDIVDYDVLKESMWNAGDHFIFTCSCGIAECTGRTQGVNVMHYADVIEWNDLDYQKVWRFEKAELVKEMDKISEEIKIYSGLIKNKGLELKTSII